MPIYEYKCAKCGQVSEVLVGVVQEEGKISCSHCGSQKMEKVFPSGFAVARDEARTEGACCGLESPCDNPKRCCEQ